MLQTNGRRFGAATIAGFCLTATFIATAAPPRGPVDVQQGRGGMVVSASAPASQAGRDVLLEGGNAVDAAVATALALAVTWPEAGNIGGGGFMMISPPDQPVVCIDYRETAPARATRTTFVHQTDYRCTLAAGVPGTLRGLELGHAKFGKLPWPRLVAPAIELAERGFTVDKHLAHSLNSLAEIPDVETLPRFAELRRVYGRADGRPWQAGDTLTQPDLAATLRAIAEGGADAFYTGPIAASIAETCTQDGGLIEQPDLAAYRAKLRPALHRTLWGYDVYGPPPPSSGGAVLLLQLATLEAAGFPAAAPGAPWSAEQLHLMAEAMRRAYRERAATLGDPDFVGVPAWVNDPRFAERLAATIDRDRATPSSAIAGGIAVSEGPYESPQTTHFSVMDGDGLAVSNTYTLEDSYGSAVVVRGRGFLLNNEMGDFNWRPGYTSASGDIGTPPNEVAPGKRMLSSQTPVIVRKQGRAVVVTGSPGGRTIINTVTCILLQRLALGRSLAEAVEAPRIHHAWYPDRLWHEGWAEEPLAPQLARLKEMGHKIGVRAPQQGAAHSIEADPETGTITGVADWRLGGAAAAAP